MTSIPGISKFQRTVAIHRAACDASEMVNRGEFAYHYVETADIYVKIQKNMKYQDSPAVRGAIAWALRCPHRQVTILKNGKVLFE